ncbi:hypothetical protein NUW54_g10568 [Trametes sanguinea]|uniref:Uncharacterized protein n=1 Tax=Trametes sanguinea TaxID=158606 RepID=A0ACC1NZT5_9APHY|nr:hypothetical protein NUW54_g10568 [Trametes sanguinea]
MWDSDGWHKSSAAPSKQPKATTTVRYGVVANIIASHAIARVSSVILSSTASIPSPDHILNHMRDDATGTHLYGGTDDAGHGDCASTSSSSQRRADWTNSLNPPPKRPSQIGLPFRMHPRPTSGVHEYPLRILGS